MGRDVARTDFAPEDRQRYRGKVRRCLDALARMLRDARFAADEPYTGLEMELNLVDEHLAPALVNAAVLAALGSPEFSSELGRWNLEINLPPRALPGDEALHWERYLVDSMADADAKAGELGARLVMIGVLPTLREQHMRSAALSPDSRYALLNQQMLAARGEPFRLDIEGRGSGPERLVLDIDSIAPEAACTSMQLHLQVPPDCFAAHWNAAQCLAGVQLALGANSPFLFERRLWAETRVPLFTQAADVRSEELRNQGVRPRVWFGERWITSIFDLFEENVRYFPGLLPVCEDEDPVAELDAGRPPGLHELCLHNGTIWRWNRPVYDVVGGTPHVRVENRVLPAGPTAVDAVANAMFFYGVLRVLAEQERPLWTQMSFDAAQENFYAAARSGMDTQLYWPGLGWVRPDELVLRRLLPLAHDGLARWGVSPAAARHYLDVVEQRCLCRRTGASWQLETVARLEERGATRLEALRGMLARYLEAMAANEPVHCWP